MNGNLMMGSNALGGISHLSRNSGSSNKSDLNINESRNMKVLLASDLRHFVDMVYVHAVQKGFLPEYVCQREFKSHIEDVRRFDRENDEKAIEEQVKCKIRAMSEAYVIAMIVYGFIKELAHNGNGAAAEVYETLKQLMPFRIG